MSKTSTPAHGAAHMSPAQAAQHVGVSRWTIMRAIKSNEIRAFRDNRNQWKISEKDLLAWRSSSVRTAEDVHQTHTNSSTNEVNELRLQLATAISRAEAAERARDQAERERDRWHDLAVMPWWKKIIGVK